MGSLFEPLTWQQRIFRVVNTDVNCVSDVDKIERIRRDPTLIYAPLGIVPDPWQREVLTCSDEQMMLLCSRQSGKSQTMAALALIEALIHPGAEVLIVSKTLRQSVELLRKVKELWRGVKGKSSRRRKAFVPESIAGEAAQDIANVQAKGWDGAALIGDEFTGKVKDRALSLELPNESRITGLPGSPDNIVGFSAVTLLIIDEAARVGDALYNLVRPFLTATKSVHGRPGRLVVASTPFGKRGWFFEAWQRCQQAIEAHAKGKEDRGHADAGRLPRDPDQLSQQRYQGDSGWLRRHWRLGWDGKAASPPFRTFRIPATECPRISKEFLEDERAQIGDRWFAQEFMTEFVDAVDSVFSHDLIHKMLTRDEGDTFKLWFQ